MTRLIFSIVLFLTFVVKIEVNVLLAGDISLPLPDQIDENEVGVQNAKNKKILAYERLFDVVTTLREFTEEAKDDILKLYAEDISLNFVGEPKWDKEVVRDWLEAEADIFQEAGLRKNRIRGFLFLLNNYSAYAPGGESYDMVESRQFNEFVERQQQHLRAVLADLFDKSLNEGKLTEMGERYRSELICAIDFLRKHPMCPVFKSQSLKWPTDAQSAFFVYESFLKNPPTLENVLETQYPRWIGFTVMQLALEELIGNNSIESEFGFDYKHGKWPFIFSIYFEPDV